MNINDKRFAYYPLLGFCLTVGIILFAVSLSPKPRPVQTIHTSGLLDAPVPDFTLNPFQPDAAPPVTLHSFYNKQCVVLYFLSSQCGLCRILHQRVITWAAKNAGDKAVFFGIHCSATEPHEALQKWIGDDPLGFPLREDNNGILTHYFQVRHTPTFAIIDRRGILRYLGAFSEKPVPTGDTPSYAECALAAALAGQPIPVKTYAAVGCVVHPLDGRASE